MFLSEYFELILFTSALKSYADKVLEKLDPKNSYFSHRFYREDCVMFEENLFVKDLRRIGNRKLEVIKYYNQNMLIVDNASYSYFN